MKKNSDTRNGRYESPFLPSDGRRIWSRTARMAISPRFCRPRGTSLGVRNAAQKNTITTSAARIARSIGLVNPNEPIVKNGFQLKSCRPGAGNPHPLKMWQPPLASALTSPVTGNLPPWPLRRLLPAEAVDDVADRDAQADQHVAEHRPARFQAPGPALRRGLLLRAGDGFVAVVAHVTRLAAPVAAVVAVPARRRAS